MYDFMKDVAFGGLMLDFAYICILHPGNFYSFCVNLCMKTKIAVTNSRGAILLINHVGLCYAVSDCEKDKTRHCDFSGSLYLIGLKLFH